MRFLLTGDAAAVTATATALTAVILLVAAVIAFQQAKQTRLLREAQVRPFVVVDFDAQSQQPLIMLTITNHGSILARKVTFRFVPPLSSSFDSQASQDAPKVADLNIFRNGIPSLAPGKVISLLFDTAIDRRSNEDAYAVHVRYEGAEGRTYEEDQALDLSIYWGSTYVARHGVHDIHERLKEIKGIMDQWRTALGSGLLLLSPQDVQERMRQWRERNAATKGPEVEHGPEVEQGPKRSRDPKPSTHLINAARPPGATVLGRSAGRSDLRGRAGRPPWHRALSYPCVALCVRAPATRLLALRTPEC